MATKVTVNAQQATSPVYPYQPSTASSSSLGSSRKTSTSSVKLVLKIKKR